MLTCNETQSANKNIVLSMVDIYQFKPYFYSSLPHLQHIFQISLKSSYRFIILSKIIIFAFSFICLTPFL